MHSNKKKSTKRASVIIPRPDHGVSRAGISNNALKVLYRLKKAGYCGYLVGGSVRDLLLGKTPKDFDVATDASPEEVKKLFRNCRLIGRRFRLAHVHFGYEIVEVATFRAMHDAAEQRHAKGMILRDNVYGTLDEDAWRRDFTINALYYNIADYSVVDFCDGLSDLKHKTIKMIGDARQRYHEDPVRLLRAIRFAGKLEFHIHPSTEAPIFELGELLSHVSPARLFEEVLKLFLGGHSLSTFKLLHHYKLMPYLFGQTTDCLNGEEAETTSALIAYAFQNTDERIAAGKSVNPAFLFSALLWSPLQKLVRFYKKKGNKGSVALTLAINHVLSEQVKQIAIPKRLTQIMREIWDMQQQLQERRSKRVLPLLHQRRFRAGYDFLALRAQAGEKTGEAVTWWTNFQEVDSDTQQQLILELVEQNKKNKRPRRPRAPKTQ